MRKTVLQRFVQANAFALIAIFATGTAAQPHDQLRVDREKVLSFDMAEQAVGPYSSVPYEAKTGLVWRKRILHSNDVSALRLHVKILHGDIQARWKLVFRDLQETEVDSLSGGPDRSMLTRAARLGEYWSDEIRGKGGIVELWSDTDPTGLEIILDRYAFRKFPSLPQAITGRDDRLPIWSPLVRPGLQDLGKPIARLRFMVASGGQALCTGFLVTADLLITNEHCIRTESELLSTVAEFGYDRYGSLPDRVRAKVLELTDAGLDYSVIRLASSPPGQHGKVSFETQNPLSESLALLVIEHPAGEPKQVSITDCRVSGSRRKGVGGQLTDFGHLCDTLGGSSGSPVIDINMGRVVGLHHLGFNDSSPDPVNQAVYLDLILKDIQQRNPQLFQEITQHSP